MNSRRQFSIGNVKIGGDAPIVVQSMTNTDTLDVAATASQIERMAKAGAEMVRVTVPSMKEVETLRTVKGRLAETGAGSIPLIADVHFNPKVAEAVAPIVDKVRINPGNFTDKRNFSEKAMSEEEYQAALERMASRARPLIDICRENGTAIRVGINHGSLCDRIVGRYGNTPEAMVASAMEWLEICTAYGFGNIVVSMKSSNVLTMMEATRLLHARMLERNLDFPLHLGVTEAGNGVEGRAKSAAGIGALLLSGIGDTIRVSLTEDPENEPPFAHKLVSSLKNIIPESVRINGTTLHFHDDESDYERWLCRAAAVTCNAHSRSKLTSLELSNPNFTKAQISETENIILQSCRIRLVNTEFIACPSCGRTQYDIQTVLSKVKERFSGHPNLKIGVMGCIVNGPGEMADADFGIVGATRGLVCVYEGKRRISAPIEVGAALDLLERTIENSLER